MESLALTFNDVNFSPVRHDQQIWLSSSELAQALGYKQENAVSKIFNRNSDEFTEKMTQIIDNPRLPNLGMRIFSLRGCHLIAMLARTTIAKKFRKWVLDILDKEVGQSVAKTHKSEREPLTNAVNLLVAKTKHLNYSDAYKLVHQRFNVKHIDEIPYDEIPVAVEYIHHLIAFYNASSKQGSLFDDDSQKLIEELANAILNQNCMTSCLYRTAHAINPENAIYYADLVFETNIALLKLSRALNIRGPHNRKLISDDLKTASYTIGNQYFGGRWFHPLIKAENLIGVLQISRS